jgi:hypothetical protein
MRRLIWLGLFLLVVISFSLVFIPAWIIQPFKAQTPDKLELAYQLRRLSPFVTAIAATFALASTIYLWRIRPRWWKKAVLIFSLFLLSVFTWFSFQNYFEWMFRPVTNPDYVKASDAKFVDKMDMVLAVTINGDSAAYPVRQLAYHHLVHDTVGGVSIVATY